MKAKEIIGEGAWGMALKGAAALTGYNVLTDPGAGVGRALAKTGNQVKDFVGDVYHGLVDADKATPAAPASDSSRPANNKQRSDDPAPAPAPPPESAAEPAPAPPAADESEDARGRRLGRERLANWPPGQNESVKKKFAVTEANKEKEDPLTALRRGIYDRESRSGKLKTDRPNYAGAIGPMQIMPKTFAGMKKNKLIPKDFDIKNPEHNKQAGKALLAHYYKKYNGDTAKVAAAYYAGEDAINKDGTINTHWRDKKNPKAPTVGEYINQVMAKANLPLPAIAATTTLAGQDSGSNSVAKPIAANPADPAKEKLLQMPDYSMGYKRGDKFIPVTDKGLGAPVDYDQTYNQAQRSMGISPAEALRQSDEQLAALRAANRQTVQQAPVQAPVQAPAEPRSVVPKTPEPAKVAEPTLPYAQAYPDRKVAAAQDTGVWDKFINTVTKGRVPPEEKKRIQVPESDLNDILRLAGRKNEN